MELWYCRRIFFKKTDQIGNLPLWWSIDTRIQSMERQLGIWKCRGCFLIQFCHLLNAGVICTCIKWLRCDTTPFNMLSWFWQMSSYLGYRFQDGQGSGLCCYEMVVWSFAAKYSHSTLNLIWMLVSWCSILYEHTGLIFVHHSLGRFPSAGGHIDCIRNK